MIEFTSIDNIPEHSEMPEDVACFRFGCEGCLHSMIVATQRFSSSHTRLKEISDAADVPGKQVTSSTNFESWANDCEPLVQDCPYEEDIKAALLMINEG